MSKKLLFVACILLAMLAAGLVTGSGEQRTPKLIPEENLATFDKPASSSRAPCYYLGYYGPEYYYWSAPDITWGDDAYAQRFTVAQPETLMHVRIMIYDDLSGMCGNDDVYCTIYDDDGAGLPGTLIAQVVVPAGTYPFYPTWTYFDFTAGPPVIVNGDFHVAFSSSGLPGIDYENCLSDDGSYGLGRSSSRYPDGSWVDMLTGWTVDVNFMFEVYLCQEGTDPCSWQPGDPHKMHYPQLPDEDGWDVDATIPVVMADDWRCSESGYVEDIHFWGSWKHGIEGQILFFVLSIHEDIPADVSGTGYSMPGQTLWEREIWEFGATPYDPPTAEGWYDPRTDSALPNDHNAYFRYDVCLDTIDWFWQDSGTIYWLNISAVIEDTVLTRWGWKNSENHFWDDAVWSFWGDLVWMELYEPLGQNPLMNAFGVTIDPYSNFVEGYGEEHYGEGWYYYPWYDWWNIWFYDHPFTYDRIKKGVIEFDLLPFDAGAPGFFEIAVNWSTDVWSLDYPADSMPPLPGMDEDLYIGRMPLFGGDIIEGHYYLPFDIWDYNPEWVSVDVRGFNFDIQGVIVHDCLPSMDMAFVITGAHGVDTCEYYKPPYLDYSPQGMPDFDQKQNGWFDAVGWTHCGPVSVANCMWWFDSKFETNPVDPRPFGSAAGVMDNYPLVVDLTGLGVDDHDTSNVQPLVNNLAGLMGTNVGFRGTTINNLVSGTQQFINNAGLSLSYKDTLVPWPTYDYIRDQVLDCQDVILLLDFCEYIPADDIYCYIGSHYVTVAGVCTTQAQICISDPLLDALEGEPPAGSVHGGEVHNDADNISGPHSQIHHDPYTVATMQPTGWPQPVMSLNYPIGLPEIDWFVGLNTDIDVCPYQGGQLYTFVNWAYVICPVDTCQQQYPGDVNSDGTINIADVAFLVDFLFMGGPAPNPGANGDPNGDCCIDYNDVIYLIKFLVAAGPPPVACTCMNPPVCHPAPIDIDKGKVKHNTDGFNPSSGSPIGTAWHELWPQYCEDWTLTSWRDNDADGYLSDGDVIDFTHATSGRVIWEKVIAVTTTITASQPSYPDSVHYFDLIDPPNPMNNPINNSMGTRWHRVYTDYCRQYMLVINSNLDLAPLAFGNSIVMQVLNGPDSLMGTSYTVQAVETDVITVPVPVEGDLNLHNTDGWRPPVGTPIGTHWHELWPVYCQNWTLTSWFDGWNDDGMLSVCDYIDITNDATSEWKKYHVEWVGPTITVLVDDVDTMYLEYLGFDNPMINPIEDPLKTFWHEKYPVFSNVYAVITWIDNGNGYLDYCDYIVIRNNETNEQLYVHVIAVDTDMLLKEIVSLPPDPLPQGDVFNNTDGYHPPDGLGYGTTWHELYPVFSIDRTLVNIVDNGDNIISICDTIYLEDATTMDTTKYHVEWVGPTIKLTGEPGTGEYYMEYIGYDYALVPPMPDPVGTYWHQSYPVYCETFFCVQWIDNGNEYLDSCDYIVLQNMESGEFSLYHVEGYFTDIIAIPDEECDCEPGNPNADAAINILDITYLIAYLYKGGPPPTPYRLCSGDPNCDCVVNILDITYLISFLYKGGPPPCTCEQWLAACGPPLRK